MEQQFRALDLPVEVIHCTQVRLSAWLRCWRRLRQLKPDIVHTIGQTANVVGRSAAALAGVPIIIASERNTAEIKGQMRLWVDKLLSRTSNFVISNSRHSAEFFARQHIVDPAKIQIIQNGIDASALPLACGSGIPPRLGSVGELRRTKYHSGLLRAMQRVIRDIPAAVLEIAGDGALRNEVEREIQCRGLARNVLMRGWVHQIGDFLRELDIYIHAAHHEGLPNAIIEAMACGLPCVAFNTSGCAELIQDGKTGLLAPLGDYDELGAAAVALLRNPELRQQLGLAAREFITNHFSIERMVQQHLALYSRALSQLMDSPPEDAAAVGMTE
jgi:glycosyltransferase involved in cell wall biosynthesis